MAHRSECRKLALLQHTRLSGELFRTSYHGCYIAFYALHCIAANFYPKPALAYAKHTKL